MSESMKSVTPRNSSIELLRIIAAYLIVLRHFVGGNTFRSTLHRFRGHRCFPTPDTLDSQTTHNPGYLVTTNLVRIPALRNQLSMHLTVSVHTHEEILVNRHDVTS